MSGSDWRDAAVRHAEQALTDAVRTADEIIADAVAELTGPPVREAEPPEEPSPPTILHDAW
jgi:hypothetical protein